MNNVNQLKELVQVARDGAEFYEQAFEQVQDSQLRSLFSRMAAAKRELINGLSASIAASGEVVPPGGTLSGALRKVYAQVRATLARDETRAYVAQLEDAEDRLLEHLRRAIREADDPSVLRQLEMYLPRVRDCHDEMRALKQRMAA
ncbi:PA2169 family four-helix-bundle protein [Solimonas sp. K1W22B-7]|uniref:PA2169 family four-helix-bundle protein n=1 Tax=Solimonas sp. K1W22B-7 TaxID=2303331 RepID=UPI000E3358DD|nr:PA2169 family four-helix-bundle protein [Solimonas sp. K1W22B-7]AXQ27365.1 PA2169 family four-helix-bundle protein [Solimonas sp. K1W22B-7]